MNPQTTQPTQLTSVAPEPVVPNPTQPVPPVPTKSRSKLPFVLGGIIVLGIVGVLGVVGVKNFSNSKAPATIQPTISPIPTPTIDPTVDWKTYINSEYGYSFQYPQDWKFSFTKPQNFKYPSVAILSKDDPSQPKVAITSDDPNKFMASYTILIQVDNNPKNLSAKDYFLKDVSPEDKQDEENKLKEYTVGGVRGILFRDTGSPSSGLYTMIQVSKNNMLYSFEYNALAHPETHNKYLDLYTQILSTFKFLDKVTPTPILAPEDISCGGFSPLPTRECPSGYICKLPEALDAPGKCVKNNQ
jgi:hypothetical protein